MNQYLFVILCLLLKMVNGKSIKKDDDHYLIYVNNTYGMSTAFQKRQEPQQFVNSVMEEIQQLIDDNKDTYQNPEELDVLEEKNAHLKKRNSNSEIKNIYQISSLDEISVLSSYLSDDINEKVNSLPGVIGSEPKRTINMISPNEKHASNEDNKMKMGLNIEEEEEEENYIINNIKLETGWKDVGIREDADLHLSLISQGYYNDTDTDYYDNKYYYPKSAGKDVDIYVIDSGFNFRHPEFANKKERTAKCLGFINKGVLIKPESDDQCDYDIYKDVSYHGKQVSDCAAGLTYGVASKANIFGLVLEDEITTYQGEISTELFILAFDYILNNIPMKPHKSIINISWGDKIPFDDYLYIEYLHKIFNKFNEKGIVVVVAAGNEGEPVFDTEQQYIYLPCALDNTLCVGAVDNWDYFTMYQRSEFSNYGEQVDIYGPGYVNTYMGENSGTSFASPIVAGVAATLMSEHPEIKFNTKNMIYYLNSLGQKDILTEIHEGNNVLVNNGKKSIYFDTSNEIDEIPTDIENYDEAISPIEIIDDEN